MNFLATAIRVGKAAFRRATDLARRRPRLTLYLGILVVPALFVLTLLPDLFLAIPWDPYRRALTVCGFLAFGLMGLLRLATVRPGDDLPPQSPARGGLFYAVGLWLACLALLIPILRHPYASAHNDWDLNFQRYEAVRQTILRWGQWPWWDPWTRGGFPLAGNPQCGVWGVATPLVLIFGTPVGMRLATVACLLLSAEGARRLALRWLGDPCGAVAAGLIYALHGGMLMDAVAGYHTIMSVVALPWILNHLASLGRGRLDGVGFGFWLAFAALNGINYGTIYTGLIVAIVWARAAVARGDRRFWADSAIGLGVALALAGWRVAATVPVFLDFPRVLRGSRFVPFSDLPNLVLGRFDPAGMFTHPPQFYTWATQTYLGPVAVALAIVGVARGWRWWHTLAVLGGWLAMGTIAWYQPSHWLQGLPLFSTMYEVTRWRFVAMLGVALSAAGAIATLRTRPGRLRKVIALGLVGAIGWDYEWYAFRVLPLLGQPRIGLHEPPDPPPTVASPIGQLDDAWGYPALVRGYGVIHVQEPLLGLDVNAPTDRTWAGGPGDLGEFWTDRGPLRPESWSPNRVVLRARPGELVSLNQNPGSWWVVNGRRAFPGMRCAETRRPFRVQADGDGWVILEVVPPHLAWGWALHLGGLAVAFGAWRWASSSRVRLPEPPDLG